MTASHQRTPRLRRMLLIAALLAALITIPGQMQTPIASADCEFWILFCDLDTEGGDAVTVCPIAKTLASYDLVHRTSRATFELDCPTGGSSLVKGEFKVNVSYDRVRNLAQESIRTLDTNARVLDARWSCPRDPWQPFGEGDAYAICSLDAFSDRSGVFQSYTGSTAPVSAQLLTTKSKTSLHKAIETKRAQQIAAYKVCYADQEALPKPLFELPYLTPQPLAEGATLLIKAPAGACQKAVFEVTWQWYDSDAKQWKEVKAFDGDLLPDRYEFLQHPFGRNVAVPYKGTWMVKARFAPLMDEQSWNTPWASRTFTMK